ncbi:hypothetical protein [Formosa haliotis]|uniref:hypothetical protein n=1 Tax=Formosa haliotis TaxID=1555194 RepID=UPI000825BF1E|nr:hypothetical protein [Formosa haliotis]
MRITKTLFFLICTTFLLGCGNTKYTYNYEKGKHIDFSKGKWILNDFPTTNNKKSDINTIALSEFKTILDDSLFTLHQIRKENITAKEIPFNPSTETLKDLKRNTHCDYLINIKSIIEKEDMSSFAHAPRTGNTIKTNQAQSTVKIYDLNTGSLLSESTVIGTATVKKDSEDSSWDYVNTATNISNLS